MSAEQNIDISLAFLSKSANKVPEDIDLKKHLQEKKEELFLYIQDIIEDLKEAIWAYDASGRAGEHLERIIHYVVADPNGRLGCGIFAIFTYDLFAPKALQTEENIKLAYYLGCCFEMMKGVAYIADDIIDNSTTRRKKLCWYKLEDVRLSAINDLFILKEAVFVVLKKHFSHLDCYGKLLELLREAVFVGSIGQYLDNQTQHQDFTTFTMEQYRKITQLKTSYLGGYIAGAAGLHLAGAVDSDVYQEARNFCVELGSFFQFQNDFTDCYGDTEVIGKLGTDIEEGKCTWLACKYLELATSAQKEIFKENYGKDDPLCIQRIKQLYDEVSMVDICLTYKDYTLERIRNSMQFYGLENKTCTILLNCVTNA